MKQLAFVGLAHIHTPGFISVIKKRSDLKIKTVWDHDAARASKAGVDLGVSPAHSVREIFEDSAIDAVVICSETNRHERLAIGAAAAKKHLFVEKPLGFRAKDAYTVADAIAKAGVIFSTGYFQRGWPANRFIKEQIAKGAFGRITRVRGSNCHSGALNGWFNTEWRWMADPTIAGCGAFGDLGTHSLDILLWWMGDVSAVTAMLDAGTATYPNCDETGEGLLRFTTGAIGTLAGAWDDLANPLTYLVSGTEAHAAVVNGQVHFQTNRKGESTSTQPLSDQELPAATPAGFEAWLNAVSGQPNQALVTAREAAYRSAVMEALYNGAARQSWVTPEKY